MTEQQKHPAPAKRTEVILKKAHTHGGVLYELEEDKPPPKIKVTDKQKAWLTERGII